MFPQAHTRDRGVHEVQPLPRSKYRGGSQKSGNDPQDLQVAFCRALANEPKLLLADEPTGNLDSGNADSLFDLFVELRDREGQTFVVVTHNEKLAARGDRTVSMRDGLIVS